MGVEGQGGVTLSYVCPHCHRVPREDYIWWISGHGKKQCNWWCAACGGQYDLKAPNRVLVIEDSTDCREAKVFLAHAAPQQHTTTHHNNTTTHHSTTHYSTTHYSTPTLQHSSTTALQHYSTTTIQHYNTQPKPKPQPPTETNQNQHPRNTHHPKTHHTPATHSPNIHHTHTTQAFDSNTRCLCLSV